MALMYESAAIPSDAYVIQDEGCIVALCALSVPFDIKICMLLKIHVCSVSSVIDMI